MNCPRCGTEVPGRFCPQCGLMVVARPAGTGPVTCSSCGHMFSGNFCPLCGTKAPLTVPGGIKCVRCGTLFRDSFCPVCGLKAGFYYPAYQEMSLHDSLKKVIHVFGSFFWIGVLITFILLLAINSGYLLWGMSQVIPGIMEERCATCAVYIYVLSPVPLTLLHFSEPSWFLSYYLILLTIISSSIFLAVFLDGRKLVSDMMTSIGRGRLKLSTKSSWAMAGQLFCTYLFFNMAYLVFLWLFGVEVTSPTMEEGPLWYYMFEFANASVYEEVVTRLVFLGTPMFLIALGSGIRGRQLLKELFGGSGRMAVSTWTLIFISAAIFGIAHILYWDVYKVVPAFIAGLILGYVYVKRGIWASILFHFVVDYYAVSFFVSSNAGHTAVLAFLAIAVIIFIIAGFFFFIYYSGKVVKLVGSFFKVPSPAPTPAGDVERRIITQPSVQQVRQFGFLCSRCGFPEARYLDGKFQCLRCGFIQ